MKRRHVLLLAAVAVMIGVVAIAQIKKSELLVLQWAKKAPAETPPVAVLIEMGLKDAKPRTWNGRAVITGAKVVHREGYRFREGDRLVEPDAWTASSHRPMRPPAQNLPPAVTIKVIEPNATVGVVLHLADVADDARVTLDAPDGFDGKAVVALGDILSGKGQLIWDGNAIVRLVTTATPVATDATEDDFPAAAYGPDGTLWVAYISYHTKKQDRRAVQGAARGFQGALSAGVRRSAVRQVFQGRQVERAGRGNRGERGPGAMCHRSRGERYRVGCL
jgi:hypothetical protein